MVRFKNFPILYSPYYSFALNHQRKTGFLTPHLGYSSRSGFQIGLPFYWNMAPNYDLTLTPTYLVKRGFQMISYFRYLSQNSIGNIYASYLPDDKEFQRFRRDTQKTFSNALLYNQDFFSPYLNQLNDFHNYRAFISMTNVTHFNSEWSTHLNLNYVTDPLLFPRF